MGKPFDITTLSTSDIETIKWALICKIDNYQGVRDVSKEEELLKKLETGYINSNNKYRFDRNHHALEIEVMCTSCPSREEVIMKVLEKYPHTDPVTVPSQEYIQHNFEQWYRYGSFNFSMPYPWQNTPT